MSVKGTRELALSWKYVMAMWVKLLRAQQCKDWKQICIQFTCLRDLLWQVYLNLNPGNPLHKYAGIILCMRPANWRRRYIVTSSPVGWAHTQYEPWICDIDVAWHYGCHHLITPEVAEMMTETGVSSFRHWLLAILILSCLGCSEERSRTVDSFAQSGITILLWSSIQYWNIAWGQCLFSFKGQW